MATVTAISTKGGGGGKGSLRYICRDDKTENKKWVTAINCTPETAYQEFRNTKKLFNKIDGTQYFHFVQSHPSGYDISPELALEIAREFAKKAFDGFQCVIACHTDAPHIHCHFIVNSVSCEDGHKFRSNKFTLKKMRELSDEICKRHGVVTLDKSHLQKKSKGVSAREYHAAMKGDSWKVDLICTIDYAMKKAKSKKHFCWLMRQEGYSVKWQDNHKYITYTCPNGCRVRDDGLHEEKYRKEMMEREFKIRRNEASLARERREGTRHFTGDDSSRQQLEGSDRINETDFGYAGRDLGDAVELDAESGDELSYQSDRRKFPESNLGAAESAAGLGLTGWETERAILIADETARRIQAQAQSQTVDTGLGITGSLSLAADGLALLASLTEPDPVEDDVWRGSDKKTLAKEFEKKEELGMKMY